MHDDIKKFSLEGFMRETDIVKTKERIVEYVEGMMRDYSYVPALDLEPQFTLSYDGEQGFKFELSVYGVRVEKDEVWKIGGIMNGKEILKHIPQHKLKQLQTIAI